MFQSNPKLSLSTPFPLTEITAVVNHIWNVNQFDDDASSDEDDRTSSDEVSDSKDEEEMAQLLKMEKKKLKKKEKKTTCSKTKAPTPMSTKDTPKDTDEIADLIDKLASLDIKDPSYPAMYFCIIVHAPNMVPFLAKPSTHSSEISTHSNTTGEF